MSDSFDSEFRTAFMIGAAESLARDKLSRSLNKHEEYWIAAGWTPATLHRPDVRDE